jgi:hypothetical protein
MGRAEALPPTSAGPRPLPSTLSQLLASIKDDNLRRTVYALSLAGVSHIELLRAAGSLSIEGPA